MKKIFALILLLTFLINSFSLPSFASGDEDPAETDERAEIVGAPEIDAPSAILIEMNTGSVLYAKNANEPLPPASVTKIMTLLLVAEALSDGSIRADQRVRVSENASSMGGSQIFLKEGEEFTVTELLKSTVIASANDAAVALAELISGSEEAFVDRMNERAAELGMKNTYFENATGLDDTTEKHLTSAYDIALMSRELMKHSIIKEYSSRWQDNIRDGEFILTNTNRLVRYYDGCTGLKTGSTDKAGFCISATAERDGMALCAVIMGAETRDERNNAARALLDYGFAGYTVYKDDPAYLEDIPILRGELSSTGIYSTGFIMLLERAEAKKVEKIFEIPDHISAPMETGEAVGKIVYKLNEKTIGECDIVIKEDVGKLSFFDLFSQILLSAIAGKRDR